jgi:hypothetical protein
MLQDIKLALNIVKIHFVHENELRSFQILALLIHKVHKNLSKFT